MGRSRTAKIPGEAEQRAPQECIHLPAGVWTSVRCDLSIFLFALLLSGCRQQPSGRVIARVGTAELTLDEAKTHIDTTRAAFDYALNDYASYWVNTELLYQEAKRQGVENSPEFTRQLEEVRRQ